MIYPAPPSHLTGLVTEVNKETLLQIQQSYGDNTTAFKFNSKFDSLVRTWIGEYNNYGGTVWGVDTEKNKILLFDQFKHGYNGVMEINEEEDLNSPKNIDLPPMTELIIAFQYSGDEQEYLEDGISKFEQDYFGWVVIYKLIDKEIEEIISYECA